MTFPLHYAQSHHKVKIMKADLDDFELFLISHKIVLILHE